MFTLHAKTVHFAALAAFVLTMAAACTSPGRQESGLNHEWNIAYRGHIGE
jgi:hypothetical protein